MSYATKEDLAAWLGYEKQDGTPDVSLLPDGVDRIIRNASRVIDEATMGRINITNERHKDVAMTDTAAQCEYWLDGVGESVDINPKVSGYTAGKSSFQFTNGLTKLAPRARRELWLGGLLSRRVRGI